MTSGSFAGGSGSLGMGVAFVLEDYFSQTADEIERRMGKLGVYTDKVSNDINTSLNQMKVGAVALFAGIGLLAPFFKGAELQAQFEADQIALQTLLGTAEAAKKVFGEIKQTAAVTPFQTKDLLQANIALISQGVEAGRSQEIVNNLGNALAAVGKGSVELERMAINLQQISANGQASAMDIKQFGYAGINIMKLFEDATGKTAEQLKGHKLTLEDIELALKHAGEAGGKYFGAMDRLSQSVQGKMSTLADNVSFTFAALGQAIEPLTHKLLDFLINATNTIQAFAATEIGGTIFKIIAVLGIFLVVGGLALLLLGATKFAAYSAANAFSAKTKAVIIDTIATKGLTAGMTELAAATWAALAPLLPYVAAVAAIIGVIYLVNKGIDSFNDMMEKGTEKADGFLGILQKLGGIIRGVWEIMKSANDEGFSMPEEMEAALNRLGILQFVVNLGTWIVRIKAIFNGMLDVIVPVLKTIWEVLKATWNVVKSVFVPMLESMGIHVDKIGGKLETFKNIGKALAVIIIASLIPAIVSFIVAAAPIIATILGVIAVVWIVWQVLKIIGGVLIGLAQIFIAAWGGIIDILIGFVEFLWDLVTGKSIAEAGHKWAMSFKEAFLSAFSGIKRAIIDILLSIPGMGYVMENLFGYKPDEDRGMTGNQSAPPPPLSYSRSNQMNQVAKAKANNSVPQYLQPQAQPVMLTTTYVNNVHLDGEVISTHIDEKRELKAARAN